MTGWGRLADHFDAVIASARHAVDDDAPGVEPEVLDLSELVLEDDPDPAVIARLNRLLEQAASVATALGDRRRQIAEELAQISRLRHGGSAYLRH